MDMVLESLKKHKLEHRIAPPSWFSPLLWFGAKKNLSSDSVGGVTLFGTKQPSVSSILRKAYTFQLYSSSALIRKEFPFTGDKIHSHSAIRILMKGKN